MKLWDSLTTCLILLSAVHASPLLQSRQQSSRRRGRAAEGPLDLPPVQIRLSVTSPGISSTETAGREERFLDESVEREFLYSMEEPLPNDFEDVVDFIKVTISRIRRSTTSAIKGGRGGARGGETGRRTRGGGGGGRGQGCVLKQIHLNVSDLGLGYRSSEEMIFRYCSGPCRKSETNYDKILYNLVHNRKLPSKDTPPQACCRPTAFDDDLSFLDDSLVYHTMKKHSARKCGCV
uniref:Glial cell line-derived neurotrophic factor n=1 Tax=Amphiprion percula TaxID=161767 RepID=A0A3P8RP12_AMPPE